MSASRRAPWERNIGESRVEKNSEELGETLKRKTGTSWELIRGSVA
jgi:hypothetical protein